MQNLFSAIRRISLLVLMSCSMAVIAQTQTPSDPVNPPAVPQGAPECATCHKEAYDNMADSTHGAKGDARTPWGGDKKCTACHGKDEEHARDPLNKKTEFRFNKTTSAEIKDAQCQTCHKGGNRTHWKGSAHDQAGTACSDCHKVHVKKDQVMVQATQAGVCFTCHKEVRSAMLRISSHPLQTGQMACSSCHQPHGSVSKHQLVKNSVNDTCYTCHADKRGPFLWEHPPAREECVNCHAPHGSNNRPMLTARGPYLCQQCHMNPNHPSSVYSANNLPQNAAGDKMLAQNCMNCHSKIHGSNHPSGARFTR